MNRDGEHGGAVSPAVGMVDRLDAHGFRPSAEDTAFPEAYLAPGALQTRRSLALPAERILNG